MSTFTQNTMKIRHRLIRLIAPTVYRTVFSVQRPMIRFMAQKYGDRLLCGAEIGVLAGDNAKSILETLGIKKLFLIDPYEPYFEFGRLVNTKEYFEVAKKKLAEFEEKLVFIKKKSIEAVDEISDTLDFVYIDGNHDYKYVKTDIELYYPKIRKGGLIGGHDFSTRHVGVCKAALEFAEKDNLILQGKGVDWWIEKENVEHARGAPFIFFSLLDSLPHFKLFSTS